MDKIIEAVVQLIPISKLFEFVGIGKELNAALSLLVSAILIYAAVNGFNRLQSYRKAIKAANNLKPYFDYKSILELSRLYIQTKASRMSPNRFAKSGRRYKKVPIHAPGIRNGETGKVWKNMLPPSGKHWQYTPANLDEFDAKGEIYWSPTGNPRRKVFLDEDKGIPVQDIWLDVQDSLNQSIKITGYPTEKNPYLLERIIKASSNAGDIVLDCFSGSGTTLDLAEQYGRKWIGIDNSSEAIRNIFKRFYTGLEEMGDYVNKINTDTCAGYIQTTLFDPEAKYNSSLKGRKNFNFYSDTRYGEIIEKIIDEYQNV